MVRSLFTFIVLSLIATGARAEEPTAHAAPTPEAAASSPETQPPEVRVLTRQEVLLKKFSELKLPSGVIGKLFQATEKSGKLSAEEFGKIVDRLSAQPPDQITEEQKAKLKQIFQDELGNPTILAAGRELNAALARLRDDRVSSAPTNPVVAAASPSPSVPQPIPSGAPGAGQQPPLGQLGNLPFNPNNPQQQTQFLQAQLAQLQKEFATLQKNQKGSGGAGGERGAKNPLFDQILKALGGNEKNDKKGDEKGEKKDRDGDRDRKSDFAKGDTHKEDSRDEDDAQKKNDPPPKKEEAKKDNSLGALLAALQDKDKGGDNKGGTDKKGGGGDGKGDNFSLPQKKEPKDYKPKGDDDKKATDAAKSLIDEASKDSVDPAAGAPQAANAATALSVGGKSSMPGVIPDSGGGAAGSDMGGEGGGGGGGGIGKVAGSPGGGGGGGGFDGDPFRGVGQEEFGPGGGGGGGYGLEKPVAFGSGSGGGGEGSAESAESVDGGPSEDSLTKGKPNQVGGYLDMSVHPRREKIWLLDQVGSFQKRFCTRESPAPAVTALCYAHQRRKPSLTSAFGDRDRSVDRSQELGPSRAGVQ